MKITFILKEDLPGRTGLELKFWGKAGECWNHGEASSVLPDPHLLTPVTAVAKCPFPPGNVIAQRALKRIADNAILFD
ncbi:hypothetical protein MHYP_G00142340 [Metynnis hypsauchen]